ncbi:ParB/RepB/Spo0J family partition protein [Lentzea fradiae]|uniref:ParB/RepB/Spo0J family partition protein n=1 Tax=Lentzea fradiae TaxID=200378 RepID=UPI000A93D293|nr:streptomycin biosynthesis protein [Lentzea fradiae]
MIEIDELAGSCSPRLAGENLEHVRALARIDAELPPIIVHRPTMRVVDGMHRLLAAVLCGRTTIEVEFFDGDEDAAFALAVEANIAHGLPLPLADREAAAARLIEIYPDRSDRSIARGTGLSADTVGVIRRRSTVGTGHLIGGTRIGRDGRRRPVDIAAGRNRAVEFLAGRPDASLREIASAAGIAIGTARDVRERVRRGESPVPERWWRQVRDRTGRPFPRQAHDREAALRALKQDPALRFTDAGRALLRWLDAIHTISGDEQIRMLEAVPPHCAAVVADLALGCADSLRDAAERIAGEKKRGRAGK